MIRPGNAARARCAGMASTSHAPAAHCLAARAASLGSPGSHDKHVGVCAAAVRPGLKPWVQMGSWRTKWSEDMRIWASGYWAMKGRGSCSLRCSLSPLVAQPCGSACLCNDMCRGPPTAAQPCCRRVVLMQCGKQACTHHTVSTSDTRMLTSSSRNFSMSAILCLPCTQRPSAHCSDSSRACCDQCHAAPLLQMPHAVCSTLDPASERTRLLKKHPMKQCFLHNSAYVQAAALLHTLRHQVSVWHGGVMACGCQGGRPSSAPSCGRRGCPSQSRPGSAQRPWRTRPLCPWPPDPAHASDVVDPHAACMDRPAAPPRRRVAMLMICDHSSPLLCWQAAVVQRGARLGHWLPSWSLEAACPRRAAALH